MSNRIKSLDSGSIGSGNSSPVEQSVRANASTTEAATAVQPVAGDSVRITDSARQLAALSTAVQDAPDIDRSKVATLQSAIESGQYTVNPERIADSLMQMENALGAARK